MAQTLHPAPCRAPECSYTLVAALSAVSSVSEGVAATALPKGPVPDPSVAVILALGKGGCSILPPARGVAGSLDLQNPFALQGVEQLHLRVSRYTWTLS